ncbi:hypothetical protein NP493_86g01019 [Ridgeia piscesae]|uniref:Integrator complex subunit 1 RPB2-binding domain-containing protein n=1 Tax=Ridgeia piscesae TaxID=27915 RepID=A0AAD9UHX3_RIDPI|nr:hypothetical protein NP493_86g01019 [Ridgeia piscesae]
MSQTFTPLGRPGDAERRGSPTVQVYLYEELAKEVDPADFLSSMTEAEDSNDDEKIEALLCGAVKYLKMNRAKPDPAIYLALMHLARSRPSFFGSEVVIEAFCSLLKRDVSMNFKAKGNALVSVLTCNVMMAAFQDEENWPDSFVKVLLEDSLGERVWVDRADCKMFVQNVQSAFNTKFRSTTSSDTKADQLVSAGASPSQTSSFGEDEDRSVDSTADNGSSRPSSSLSEDISSIVFPRYTYQQVSIETNVLDLLRDHLTRRQPMDGGSRNLLRVMAVACGYSEVRTMAAQRLEMWLQNPKLTKAAQDLLMAVCMNCDQHSQQDVEVMSQISKIRLKPKPLINHYLFCIRELVNQHSDNLKTLMMHAVYNELSNSRNPNNMSLLSTMFNHSPELSARVLADIFQDLLCNRDDYLRAVRALMREIVKAAKHDFNFTEFALGLMEERDFHSLEPPLKDRMFLSLTDLIALTELLSITPSVREAVTAQARGCHKDTEQLRTFQKQIATIQRDAIWWLHTVVPKMFDCKSADYIHCLKKALFMEKFEYYYKLDNWPPEIDRGLMLRLVCEVPVYENTLMRVLLMGLTRELQVSAVDSLELADQLVRRAAPLHSEGETLASSPSCVVQ